MSHKQFHGKLRQISPKGVFKQPKFMASARLQWCCCLAWKGRGEFFIQTWCSSCRCDGVSCYKPHSWDSCWLRKGSYCVLIQCKTAGLKAPRKQSEGLRDELQCCSGESRSSSHRTCWIHAGLPSLPSNISVLAHGTGWCRISDTNWLKPNCIEQSCSFMSGTETQWLGCHVFKLIFLSQLHPKIKHLTSLLI